MSKFKLNIYFDDLDAKTTHQAKQLVTILKQTNDPSEVAWVSFMPFTKNTVKWGVDYALYSTCQQIESGATIDKLTDISASDGLLYDFENCIFQNPRADHSIAPNTYGLTNKMNEYEYLTFGLAQDVVVNGEAHPNHPINAVTVPKNHTCIMSPKEVITVFLEANIEDSMVLTKTKSNKLTISFENGETEKNIKYNNSTGVFYLL